ncbi:hypothetical protein [Allocatelliglobosispora scoriae]|nr:hypothetical protein [Allocatelliglobosispora scoriae]
MRSRIIAGLALSVVAAGLAVAGPAAPARAAACSGATGVTVVVDFGSLGGGIKTGCASGDPATGLAALRGAGFTTTGTQKWGPAFVCRIDGKPGAADEPCVNTPPSSAYWSYWHADRGGSWSYSNLGATAYDPKAGTVEGWAFGSGGRPGISPPAKPSAPKPSPSAKPASPRPEVSPARPTPGATGTPGGVAGSSAVPSASPVPVAVTSSPVGVATEVVSPVVAEVDAQRGGGFTGVAVAGVIIAVLAGLGVWTARRRRLDGS